MTSVDKKKTGFSVHAFPDRIADSKRTRFTGYVCREAVSGKKKLWIQNIRIRVDVMWTWPLFHNGAF